MGRGFRFCRFEGLEGLIVGVCGLCIRFLVALDILIYVVCCWCSFCFFLEFQVEGLGSMSMCVFLQVKSFEAFTLSPKLFGAAEVGI